MLTLVVQVVIILCKDDKEFSIDLLGVIYLRFPLVHKYIHGEFGAIERLNS